MRVTAGETATKDARSISSVSEEVVGRCGSGGWRHVFVRVGPFFHCSTK